MNASRERSFGCISPVKQKPRRPAADAAIRPYPGSNERPWGKVKPLVIRLGSGSPGELDVDQDTVMVGAGHRTVRAIGTVAVPETST